MNTADSKLMASPSRDTHAEHVHVSMKTYYIVFAALMVLLFLTVGAAFVNFGRDWVNITIALLIAMVKAALVVLYFMHVKYASRMTQIFVVGAFLWLGIMFLLTFSDYTTRNQLPVSKGWNDNPVRQLELNEEQAGSARAADDSHAK